MSIKIINFDHSINIVDNNNCFVGYETDIQCCEDSGYLFIRGWGDDYNIDDIDKYLYSRYLNEGNKIHEISYTEKNIEYDLNDLLFDQSYCKEFNIDDGNAIIFKLINNKNPERFYYLCFYNIHNGYYSHGLSYSFNDSYEEKMHGYKKL